ncbi:hypothetical protein ACWOE8_07015 [Enterococcus avium]
MKSKNEELEVKTINILEGERAGEQARFEKTIKNGEEGWQEQGTESDWFIREDQMKIWIELNCLEEQK